MQGSVIAAQLNVANGSDPTPVAAALAEADTLLSGFEGKLPYEVRSSSDIGKLLLAAADILEQYNTGQLTPDCVSDDEGGNASIELSKTVEGTTLTPALDLTLAVSQQDAIPGDLLTYTATVTNNGANLVLSGQFVAENTSDTSATIAYYDDLLEYRSAAEKAWLPLAASAASLPGYTPLEPAPLSEGMTLSATGLPAPGVSYPSDGDGIVGTVMEPGSVATWQYQASIALTAEQVALLLDASEVKSIRNVIHFEVTPRKTQSGQPFKERVTFDELLEGLSGDLSDVAVTIILPDGTPITFDPTSTPALALLEPGAALSVETTYQVPVPAAKGADEADADYLARLAEADGAILTATADATANSGSGPLNAPQAAVATTQHLPVLTIGKDGPASVEPGQSAIYDLALENSGSATASVLVIDDALPDGTSGTLSDVPESLEPGETALAHASYDLPSTQPDGDLTDVASLSWQDANANLYGPVSDSFTTTVTSVNEGETLTLVPETAGPNLTNSEQVMTATLLDANGDPLAGVNIQFVVSGPNATSGEAISDENGVATFTYSGVNSGTDSVQAFAGPLGSNVASVLWVTPVQNVATTTIWGRFFRADSSGVFKTNPDEVPVFGQAFPTINFNPPGGVVPGNTSGVGPATPTFTDITTDFIQALSSLMGMGSQLVLAHSTVLPPSLPANM